MLVKICGTTNLEDALLAVDAGADVVGFVFAPSRRRVTAEAVCEIVRELPPEIAKVGVFTEATPEEVLATVKTAGLTAVQLHRAYDAGLIGALAGRGFALWQVVTVEIGAEDAAAEELARVLADKYVELVLLDASRGGASGGMGQSFDWERGRALLARVRGGMQKPSAAKVVLAGGLRPETVGAAIETLAPDGVDAVSGVEAAPGRKDPKRVHAFVQAARGL